MGRDRIAPPPERPLSTPAAALPFDGRLWERSPEQVGDALLARLVRRRLQMERRQPWVVLALLVLPLAMSLALGLHFHSPVVLAGAAALAATLGVGLAFTVERAFLELFVQEGRVLGLSEASCRRLFQRATTASHMLDVMESCGKQPSDAELVSFVR